MKGILGFVFSSKTEAISWYERNYSVCYKEYIVSEPNIRQLPCLGGVA